MRRVLLLPALILASGRPSGPTAGPALLLTRLELDLRVDYGRGTVDGVAALTLRNTGDGPARAIPLLLGRLMVVDRVTDRAGAAVAFRQRVALFDDDSSRQVNAIEILPRHPLRPGDSLRVSVRYGGVLVGYTETGSLYIRDHVDHEFTILREDAYAFPMPGVLSRRANRSSPREPFSFTAQVTVPLDQVVAMGGTPRGRLQRDSLMTWSYQSEQPVPFLNIAIAPYRILEGSRTRIFSFPADSAGARSLHDAANGALDSLARWFGPLSGSVRLTVMEIPEGFGSQASLSAGIIQTAEAFRSRSELRQVYHELSHLWNVPDLDHPSPRWNEGLAMFLQWRLAAALDGWAGWDDQLQRLAQGLVRRCAPPAACHRASLQEYGIAGETDRSYAVGLLLFYALYRTVGAEGFDATYRSFVERYRISGARTADLAAAFRETSVLAAPILDEWLNTTRWYARLSRGETFAQIVAGYSH